MYEATPAFTKLWTLQGPGKDRSASQWGQSDSDTSCLRTPTTVVRDRTYIPCRCHKEMYEATPAFTKLWTLQGPGKDSSHYTVFSNYIPPLRFTGKVVVSAPSPDYDVKKVSAAILKEWRLSCAMPSFCLILGCSNDKRRRPGLNFSQV